MLHMMQMVCGKCTSVQDGLCSGQGTAGCVLLSLSDVRDICRERIGVGNCYTILSKDLEVNCICQHIVPSVVTQEQSSDCMRISDRLISMQIMNHTSSSRSSQVIKLGVSYIFLVV